LSALVPNSHLRRLGLVWSLGSLLIAVCISKPLLADDAPKPPQVLMCVPLGATAGETTRIKARGLLLEGVTEVTTATPGATVKFVSQGKVGLPTNVPAPRAGDTQVEFDLTLATEISIVEAELEFLAPHGKSTYKFPLSQISESVVESEPNPGFKQSQDIKIPQLVVGKIDSPQDVDVFGISLEQGQAIRVEVAAQVHGSAMDALLSIVDSAGTPLATSDDVADGRDSTLHWTATKTDRYFIIVQDANDLGGDAHPYRLSVTAATPSISFIKQIAPILQQHCVICHNDRKSEGGYRLDTYQAMIQSGESGRVGFKPHGSQESESFTRLVTADESQRMPADNDPLSQDQISLIRQWIDQGLRFDGKDIHARLVAIVPPAIHPKPPTHYRFPLPIGALAFSPDGKSLWVGGYHEIIQLNHQDGSINGRLDQLAQRIYSIKWHPDGKSFAVAAGNPGQLGEVRLFDASGTLVKVIATSDDVIHDVAFNAGGDQIAVAAADHSVRIYTISDGELRLEMTSHLDWVLSVGWSRDDTKLVTGSRDKTAKVFDTNTGAMIASYLNHNAPVRGVMFHPTEDEVYSSGDNHRWDRWKVSGAERVKDMYLGGQGFQMAMLGNHFVIPSSNNRVHVMKAIESDRIRELQGEGNQRILSVAGHETSDRVAAGTDGGKVIVWELSSGQKLIEFQALPMVAL